MSHVIRHSFLQVLPILVATLSWGCRSDEPCERGSVLLKLKCPESNTTQFQVFYARSGQPEQPLEPIPAVCPETLFNLNLAKYSELRAEGPLTFHVVALGADGTSLSSHTQPVELASGCTAAAIDTGTGGAGGTGGNKMCVATQTLCGATCVDLRTDVQHCGSCTNDCSLSPNVSAPLCREGVCVGEPSACLPGFAHCTSSPADVCETDLATAQHCGSCTKTCEGDTPLCSSSGGTYTCTSSCTGNAPDRCGETCANLQVDNENCGSCGKACSQVIPNAETSCELGMCKLSKCKPGFADCSSAPGCETALGSISNCSACGQGCMTDELCSAVADGFACKKTCGDGMVQAGEECDNGAAMNDGRYGGCKANCRLASRCGDGTRDASEDCDLGSAQNNGAYAGCTATCKLAPRCGDGVKNGPEVCDQGASNGLTLGACNPECSGIIAVKNLKVTPPVAADFGGVVAADNLCRQSFGAAYKAVIVDGVRRVATSSPNAGSGQVDWALKPYTLYRNAKGQDVFVTDKAALLGVRAGERVGILNPIGDLNSSYTTAWSGTQGDWTFDKDYTCLMWTTVKDDDAACVDFCASGFIELHLTEKNKFPDNGAVKSCPYAGPLLCAEQ